MGADSAQTAQKVQWYGGGYGSPYGGNSFSNSNAWASANAGSGSFGGPFGGGSQSFANAAAGAQSGSGFGGWGRKLAQTASVAKSDSVATSNNGQPAIAKSDSVATSTNGQPAVASSTSSASTSSGQPFVGAGPCGGGFAPLPPMQPMPGFAPMQPLWGPCPGQGKK
jgi:hypothetical protein